MEWGQGGDEGSPGAFADVRAGGDVGLCRWGGGGGGELWRGLAGYTGLKSSSIADESDVHRERWRIVSSARACVLN